jgi:hypothetical protein
VCVLPPLIYFVGLSVVACPSAVLDLGQLAALVAAAPASSRLAPLAPWLVCRQDVESYTATCMVNLFGEPFETRNSKEQTWRASMLEDPQAYKTQGSRSRVRKMVQR